MSEQEAVHLPSSILRKAPLPPPAAPRPRRDDTRQPLFSVARRTDNELILFDEAASESWIVYPPRSEYDFLAVRRRSPQHTIVEHHPWTAAVAPVDHVLDAREGCVIHGLHCPAQGAIAAAVNVGYNPFT
jgi:hypothetical protein